MGALKPPDDIRFTASVEGLTADQLGGFFVGWPSPPDAETHLRILRGSSLVELALVGERVVGFVTALSDGKHAAYVPLLEVLPEHQGRGVGSELVRRLLTRLEGLYSVALHCDEELRPFYARLGLEPLGGMALRDHGAQAGREG